MEFRAVLFFAFRFWPGFQKLWLKGDFHSLMVSLLFGWLFMFAWLATFVWPEWLIVFFSPGWMVNAIFYASWIGIIGSSSISVLGSLIRISGDKEISASARQSNLELAQEFYLQANYFEAERLVRKNTLGCSDDVESALLWIAILRRTRRVSQALELISSMAKLDAAAPWLRELQTEKEQCLRFKIQSPPAHD